MPELARKGDAIKISCPHGATGIITGCSPTVFDNKYGAARVHDTTVCNICGCEGHIDAGSHNVFYDGIPVARHNDPGSGKCDPGLCSRCPHDRSCYIIKYSPTTNINDYN